nr:MAG TPA: hypothetical protein [Caudoviricetes sp.]
MGVAFVFARLFFHVLESFCFKVFNKIFNKKIMLKKKILLCF